MLLALSIPGVWFQLDKHFAAPEGVVLPASSKVHSLVQLCGWFW